MTPTVERTVINVSHFSNGNRPHQRPGGVGIVLTVPSGSMIVLVPLPFGTVTRRPAGGGELGCGGMPR
jgi:hypothetical protein